MLERPTAHLSSGQRTLIGLAKAMLNRPRLLVGDELTASLDPESARGCVMFSWKSRRETASPSL